MMSFTKLKTTINANIDNLRKYSSALLWGLNNKKHDPSKTNAIKNVYVIRTHLWNNYVEYIFLKMQEQLGAENVFLMFDETKGPINHPHVKWNEGVVNGPAVITVNETDCEKLNSLLFVGERTGSSYRVESQIIASAKAIKKDYDYLWFIEYDVYSNNYKKALGQFDHIEADFLAKGQANDRHEKFRTVKQHKNWFWWSHFLGEINQTKAQDKRGCFFPIIRFSKAYLAVLEKNLSKSTGYCEAYFPTLGHINGLKLKPMPLFVFGKFRYRPVLTTEEIKKIKPNDYRLYHPVKEMIPNISVIKATPKEFETNV